MLVHIVTAANRDLYAFYLDQMYHHRAAVFVDRLKWKALRVEDGKERDAIDDLDRVEYLLTIDDLGNLVGSARLAPTTGPHLLNGPLKQFAERSYPQDEATWEVTRLLPLAQENTPNRLACRGMLTSAIQEWALRRNVKRLLGIVDEDRLAAMARNGWRTDLLSGLVETDEGVRACGVMFSCSREAWAGTLRSWGLDGPVTFEAEPRLSGVMSPSEAAFHGAIRSIALEHRKQELLDAAQQALRSVA